MYNSTRVPNSIKTNQDSRPPNHSQLIVECMPDSPFKTNKSDQITHPTLKQICVHKSTEGKDTLTKGTTCISPSSMSTNTPKYFVQTWNELNPSLQYVLPPDDDYSYVVETYQGIDDVEGDSPHFSATVRINLVNEDDARQWMEKMSNHSKSVRIERQKL